MGKRVAILGGGVAGLSAAHELAERGFQVDVYEKNWVMGGKARSTPYFGQGASVRDYELQSISESDLTKADSAPWLPGEHGFRFFPGFYRHVIDTMRRIPGDDVGTVADDLVDTTQLLITQYDAPPVLLPARFPNRPVDLATILRAVGQIGTPAIPISPEDLGFFTGRVWQILTSCEERRFDEYEGISWWKFVDAGKRSIGYQKFLGHGITRSLVAAKAHVASARTIGNIFVQLLLDLALPQNSSSDRVLNGPTSLVWIHPWRKYLKRLGVHFHRGHRVDALEVEGGRISSARVTGPEGQPVDVQADYYVLAVPVEVAASLVTPELTAADPAFGNLAPLATNVDWMNGIQYYLTTDVPIDFGHSIHIDSNWALTTISQAQFWDGMDLSRWGDGKVRGILSVDVSDWTAPGLNGKRAIECTREEIAREVWAQLKRSMNSKDATVLRDENLHTWVLDESIASDPLHPGRWRNLEALLINEVDTWKLRPEAVTRIPNLFLASDYVRTYTDLATMEAANEAARRAVNGILVASGCANGPCAIWNLHEPEVLLPLRTYDALRYAQGLPWDNRQVESAQQVLAAVSTAGLTGPLLNLAGAAGDVASTATALEDDSARTDGVSPRTISSRLAPRLTPQPDDAGILASRLAELGAKTRAYLLDWLPTGEPEAYLYGPVRSVVASGGKGIRSALCLATAAALGGDPQAALPAAATLELLHQAFLVHDDIEDGSELRRGRPALYRNEGMPLAINVGDGLQALTLRLVRENLPGWGPELGPRMVAELDQVLIETIEGQAWELGWIRDNALVSEGDCIGMMRGKTASYSFIRPLRMGALASKKDIDLSRFDRLGEALGLAFQIHDDVLNLSGDEGSYGKEIGGDLYEGKRTIPLLHLLGRLRGRDREWLVGFLSRRRNMRLPREVAQILDWMRREGSIEYGRQRALAFLDDAHSAFGAAFSDAIDGPDLAFIRGLLGYVVGRDR